MTRTKRGQQAHSAATTGTPATAETTETTEMPPDGPSDQPLTKEDYVRLANVRHALRLFARHTELELRRFHVSPQQYLLLLAIKGFPGRDWANITELAERLQIRHNAVIGLVNRAETRGFVKRIHDPDASDRRIVHVRLTRLGEQVLAKMVEALRTERSHVREAVGALEPPLTAERTRPAE